MRAIKEVAIIIILIINYKAMCLPIFFIFNQTSSDRAGACVRVLEKANQLLLFEVH